MKQTVFEPEPRLVPHQPNIDPGPTGSGLPSSTYTLVRLKPKKFRCSGPDFSKLTTLKIIFVQVLIVKLYRLLKKIEPGWSRVFAYLAFLPRAFLQARIFKPGRVLVPALGLWYSRFGRGSSYSGFSLGHVKTKVWGLKFTCLLELESGLSRA